LDGWALEVASDGGLHADDELAGMGECARLDVPAVPDFEHRAYDGEQRTSLVRQGKTARQPDEQIEPEPAFKRSQLLGQGGLRHEQAGGRGGDGQLFGRGDEVPEFPQMGVHNQRLYQQVLDGHVAAAQS
jgi:hypothetical protein